MFGFVVSWFLGSLVLIISWCRSCKVPKFPRFGNSFNVLEKIFITYYQTPISCFQEDIDRILKMFKIFKTYLQNFPAHVFLTISKLPQTISNNLTFPKITCSRKGSGFSRIILSVLVSPKMNNISIGSHGHVPKSKNHNNDGFLSFPERNRKVTNPN